MKHVAMAFGVLTFSLLAGSAHAGDPTGFWLTDDGKAKIRIAKCGANVCGNISWLQEPNDKNGKPKTDINNSEIGKRTRPIVGVPIVLAMKPDGDDKWSGKVYNAEDGKTYDGSLTLSDANTMKLQGCVAAILCKTRSWTRTQ
jgi:uncharacterized protein (DUF2147 family)